MYCQGKANILQVITEFQLVEQIYTYEPLPVCVPINILCEVLPVHHAPNHSQKVANQQQKSLTSNMTCIMEFGVSQVTPSRVRSVWEILCREVLAKKLILGR